MHIKEKDNTGTAQECLSERESTDKFQQSVWEEHIFSIIHAENRAENDPASKIYLSALEALKKEGKEEINILDKQA